MSTTNSRANTLGRHQDPAAASISSPARSTSRGRLASSGITASLIAVAAAGLTYWISGRESPWIGSNFLAAVAGTSAFPLLAFGYLRGGRREAWSATLGSTLILAFSIVSIRGEVFGLVGAFATHALVSATMEWWADADDHALLAWLRPWSSFNAVLAVLLCS